MRNVYADDKWNNINMGDYGKESFVPSCNERDVTVNRTHVLNPQSIVKALLLCNIHLSIKLLNWVMSQPVV